MEIKTHPKISNYEFSKDGKYRPVGKCNFLCGTKQKNGDVICVLVRENGSIEHRKCCECVWETFNGPIGDGEILHLNGDKSDNSYENLSRIGNERHENIFQKTIRSKAHELKRNIKLTNVETGETKYFKSKNQAGKYAGCSASMVYSICENKSKLFGGTIKFEYYNGDVDEIQFTATPDARIGKSKYTEEEKKEIARKRAKEQYAKKHVQKTKSI